MKLPISRLIIGGMLFLTGLTVLFFVITCPSSSNSQAQQPLPTITIKVKDMSFDTDVIVAKVGQPITIRLENDDFTDHALAIDGLDIWSDEVAPEQSSSITFTPTQAGTYRFFCPVAEHAQLGMVGTLQVSP